MQQTTAADQIFSIRSTPPSTRRNRLLSFGFFLADRILGLKHCREIYNRLAHVDDPASFMRQVLSQLKIAPAFDPEDLGKIPRKGGCIVVGNHTYDAIEGIILSDVLMSVRTDFKNHGQLPASPHSANAGSDHRRGPFQRYRFAHS